MDDVPNEHGPMRGRLELKHKQELSLAIDFQLSDDNTTHFEIPRETAVEPEPVRSTDVLTVPAKSKRAIRRANIANSGGEIGSNDKIKGTVRCTFGGQLEYLTTEVPETWVEAVYHNSIRGELIEENNRLGEYDYPRQKGVDATDVTCFNASQKIWFVTNSLPLGKPETFQVLTRSRGPNRTEWPEVLFRIYVNKDAGPKEKVKVWYHKNKVVLDSDRHAMRAFDDIPATISAQIEDYILVAMIHSDRRLKISDVRGRMPNVTRVANKNGDKQENLKSLNALSMMMTRFRLKAALMPRERRSGSKEIEQGLKAMLPDSCFKTSPASTKTLGRLLTDKEIKGLQEPNKGNFSFRSNRPEKRVSGVKKLDIPESSRKRKQSSPLHEADVPLEIMEDTSVAIGGKERVCKGKAREIVPNHVEGLTYSHSYGNDKAAGQLAPWGKVDRDIGSSGLIGDFPRFMASMGRPSLLTDECLRAQALEPVKNNSNQAFDDLLRPTPVPDFLSKSGLLRLDSSFPNPMEYSTKLFGKNGGPATYQIHNRTLEQAPSMASFQSSAGRVKIGEPGYQPSAAGKTNSSSELYYNFLTEQYEPFEEKNMGSYGLTGADSC
ncbi:hypothetical protein MMC27_005204 [Xylographa pallens]|nr:hypothetical protein [Xylographa pallens]